MPWWPTSGLWRHREFLNLWAAQGISAIGSRITRTAIPVMAVLTVDGSALEVGLLAALTVGPGAVVALLSGGHVDRSAKRPILVAADLLRALLVLSIPISAWLGYLSMLQLYIVAATVGCATALFQITDNAYLPTLIEKGQLVEGNAKLETTEAVAEITGPGLAGILIDTITAPLAMVVDAASYLWSALFLARIDAPETPAAATDTDSLLSDIAIGFRVCWNEPRIRPVLLATAISTLAVGFFFALYYLFALGELQLSAGTLGLIIGVGGVGGLLGAGLSSRLAKGMGTGPAMFLCLLIAQGGALLIPLAGGPRWLSISLLVAHQLIGDGFFVAYWIQAVSLRQSVLPLDVLARANAVFTVVQSSLLPLGALLAGVVGDVLGVRTALWIGLSGGMVAPFFLWPLRTMRRLPTAPTSQEQTPASTERRH